MERTNGGAIHAAAVVDPLAPVRPKGDTWTPRISVARGEAWGAPALDVHAAGDPTRSEGAAKETLGRGRAGE